MASRKDFEFPPVQEVGESDRVLFETCVLPTQKNADELKPKHTWYTATPDSSQDVCFWDLDRCKLKSVRGACAASWSRPVPLCVLASLGEMPVLYGIRKTC